MAGMEMDIASDVGTLDEDLRRAGRLALRGISDGLREGHRQYLRDNLDDPTAYTEDSLYVVGSTSDVPEVLVGVKDAQAAYLRYAYGGGRREDAVVPTLSARLDSHGNMPRGYTRAVAAAGGFWLTTPAGIRGLFVDDGAGGIEALAMKLDVDYEQRLDFEDEMEGLVDELLPEATARAFERVFGKP